MSSIIKCGPSPSKLAFWVDWKMADIISPLPGSSKRKSGNSISVEEQQIILNVTKYFQEESKSGNKPQFRAGAVVAKTAAATGVGKNSVRKIVSAGKDYNAGINLISSQPPPPPPGTPGLLHENVCTALGLLYNRKCPGAGPINDDVPGAGHCINIKSVNTVIWA